MKILTALLLVSIAAAQTRAASPVAAGEVDEKNIFAKCVTCHGRDAKGNPVMAKLFKVDQSRMNLLDATARFADAELAKVVLGGRGKMPGFRRQLKETEISAIFGYIRSLASQATATETSKPTTPEGLAMVAAAQPAAPVAKVGDVDGKKIFVKCATCHGKDAKGNPAMAKMLKVDQSSLNLVDATARFTDAELAKVILGGRGKMSGFRRQLKEVEVSAVLGYIRSLASVPAAAVGEKK